jgi:hypothetical protein
MFFHMTRPDFFTVLKMEAADWYRSTRSHGITSWNTVILRVTCVVQDCASLAPYVAQQDTGSGNIVPLVQLASLRGGTPDPGPCHQHLGKLPAVAKPRLWKPKSVSQD